MAPGVATLYRREAFLETGGFDPLYFMYSEDVEMSRRARRAGWCLLRVPSAVFHHEHDWDAWKRFQRMRLWTTSDTMLHYHLARHRSVALARLANQRVRWFAQLAASRRFARLAGALLGTVGWLTRIPLLEVRRRSPWDGRTLRAWLETTAPTLERSPLRAEHSVSGDVGR